MSSVIVAIFSYTTSGFRASDDRAPYGSMPHLDDPSRTRHSSADHLDGLSRHGSAHLLDFHSRHGSVRDLSCVPQASLGFPANGIHRVLEEDVA